ncbi:Pr6Pr family membrane protein [Silvibacterium acidisoli]|uniref:Pr6Pr family membrane protein n=1 Tax=Acidobacteriaceae bacterium ZG23-2 TaxID=2883246 RepID=UPI00406C85DD
MLARYNTARRIAALVLALTGWAALLLQLRLTVSTYMAQGKSPWAAFFYYLGFFTILTNLLAATCLSVTAAQKQLAPRTATVLSAVTVYMAMVGGTHALLLRHAWNPQGLQKLADGLLHDILPLSILVFWLLLVPKGRLQWRSPLPWLIYPLGYLGLTMVTGAVTRQYPYFFIDVTLLGYGRVLLYAFFITLAFLALSYITVAIDRAMAAVR